MAEEVITEHTRLEMPSINISVVSLLHPFCQHYLGRGAILEQPIFIRAEQNEVKTIANGLQNYSSTNSDTIPSNVIEVISGIYGGPLTQLFNKSLQQGPRKRT